MRPLSERPFYQFSLPKEGTIPLYRENINVVNSLWDTEKILEILMTMKPHKIIRDVKNQQIKLSRAEKSSSCLGRKKFPAVISRSRSGMDLVKDHIWISPSGTTRSRECTKKPPGGMDLTFSESSVVKRYIKNYNI